MAVVKVNGPEQNGSIWSRFDFWWRFRDSTPDLSPSEGQARNPRRRSLCRVSLSDIVAAQAQAAHPLCAIAAPMLCSKMPSLAA